MSTETISVDAAANLVREFCKSNEITDFIGAVPPCSKTIDMALHFIERNHVTGKGDAIYAKFMALLFTVDCGEFRKRYEADVRTKVTAELTQQITAELTPKITAELTQQITAQVTCLPRRADDPADVERLNGKILELEGKLKTTMGQMQVKVKSAEDRIQAHFSKVIAAADARILVLVEEGKGLNEELGTMAARFREVQGQMKANEKVIEDRAQTYYANLMTASDTRILGLIADGKGLKKELETAVVEGNGLKKELETAVARSDELKKELEIARGITSLVDDSDEELPGPPTFGAAARPAGPGVGRGRGGAPAAKRGRGNLGRYGV